MQALQDLLEICDAVRGEDEQIGRDPLVWHDNLSDIELRFIVAHLQLCGLSLRLHAHSGSCWLKFMRGRWVAIDMGDIHDGVVRGVCFEHEYCVRADEQPIKSDLAAIVIEEAGCLWMVPLKRLNIAKCEPVEVDEFVDNSDLVSLTS